MKALLAIVTGGSSGNGRHLVGALAAAGYLTARFAAGQMLWANGGVFSRAAWPYP